MQNRNWSSSCDTTDWLQAEIIYWLNVPSYPPLWTRLCKQNNAKMQRQRPESKFGAYDIEVPNELWSLWSFLAPRNQMFGHKTRGKQSLACNVLACCAAKLYPLKKWTPKLMDAITISGDRYHRESLRNFYADEHQFSLDDLNCSCRLENIRFKVHTEIVAYGALYEKNNSPIMNLARALTYFFSHSSLGILRCHYHRALAIGRDKSVCGDYFIYDCQSVGYPLFNKGEGTPYLLRCRTLQMLLYCLVMALEVRCKKVQFTLHKVDIHYEGGIHDEQDDVMKKLNRIIAGRKQKRENVNVMRVRSRAKQSKACIK